MTQTLPKILPIGELKDAASIMKACRESSVPIVITQNGHSEAVMMSVRLYEEMFVKAQEAALINAGLNEINSGAIPMDGTTFFNSMRSKYSK